MKAGWEVKPLGEVCAFQRGLTYSKKDEVDSGGTSVLRATNVDLETGELDLSEIRFIRSEVSVPPSKMVEPGTLLICTASGSKKHLGKTALIDRPMDFAFGGFMGLLKPHEGLLPKYLQWLMRSDDYWSFIDGLSDGANINNLKFKQLAEFPVPLPPFEEQQRIVAVLDEAFEGLARARAHTEANLRSARELFESFLDSSFSSFAGEAKEQKLDDLIRISHGFAFKSADFGTSTNSSLPIVLTPGNYTEDSCLNFTEKNTKRFTGVVPADVLFEPGELTVVMTDLSSKMKILGKPAFIESEGILHNQRIGRISFKSDDLHPRFLFHFLRTQSAQKPIRDTATGTMVRHTAPKRILNIVMRAPVALSDQERIVAQIDEVELETIRLRTQYMRTVQDLDDLRQTLLQKAFVGELT